MFEYEALGLMGNGKGHCDQENYIWHSILKGASSRFSLSRIGRSLDSRGEDLRTKRWDASSDVMSNSIRHFRPFLSLSNTLACARFKSASSRRLFRL